jgi:GT2 family glycosyltransferase
MQEPSIDNIYNNPEEKGRLWKIKNLWTKGVVIIKSIHAEESFLSYLFSRKGWRLVKKAIYKSFLILTNQDFSSKIKNADYQKWCKENMPKEVDFESFKQTLQLFSYRPTISILIPVYNTPIPFLTASIESVLAQIYPHWELCLADDCSPNEEVRRLIARYAQSDSRIKVVFRTENGHISECSNSALSISTGTYCALFDHDDLLAKDALYQMVVALNEDPSLDLIYSDEDKTTDGLSFTEPHFKPKWSPDSLLSRNYIGHLTLIRTNLLKEINGFRKEYDGSQDYDLYLRLTEKTDRIKHLPKVLYHWRMHEKSVAANTYSKPYAYIAGQKALEAALERRNEPGTVEMLEEEMLGFYSIRYTLQQKSKVSIIIPARNKSELLEQCVTSIFKLTTYESFEVIVVDNGSDEKKFHDLIKRYESLYGERFKCYRHNIPFNFSALINFGASKANGDYLLLLNNDTKVITRDWLEKMMEQCQRPSIGVVGVKLFFPDNTIQHAGIVLEKSGFARHVYVGSPKNTDNQYLHAVNNYPALTGACIMIRQNVFEEVGGFDERFAVEYNDIDFCLKAIGKGYFNIFLPSVELYHYESVSRGNSHATREKYERHLKEHQLFVEIWGEYINKYYYENSTFLEFN